jgi:hypothetical protein
MIPFSTLSPLLLSWTVASSARVGPVRLPGGSYRWEAALDRPTGTATSREISAVPAGSRLHEAAIRAACNGGGGGGALDVMAERLFSDYPAWLCRPSVTFGLLRAVETVEGGTELRSRPFGIKFLEFGKARSLGRVSVGTAPAAGDGGTERTSRCAIRIPITGGLLALPGPNNNEKRKDRGCGGALSFALRTKQTVKRSDETEGSTLRCSIVTGIAGYRPAIAGRAAPTGRLRAAVYLGTQSFLHGYIMWRFHRHCWNCGGVS